MGSTISTDPYGNIIIGGYFESMIDFDPGPAVLNLANGFFILKLDANGNFIWAKEINGGQCNVESIGHDIFGNIYFTGYFMGFVDFDPGVGNYTLSNIGGWLMDDNIFVLKLDSSGNFLWVRELGAQGSTDEEAHCLTIDNVGNVYTTGYFNSTADFDPGPAIYNLSPLAQVNAFISKLDMNGNFVWAKAIGSSFGRSIAVDSSNNVCITGWFSGTTDFDPGPLVYNLSSNGLYDAFILKLNSNGDFSWVKQIGSSGYDAIQSISTDMQGNVYTFGGVSDTVDFDPGVTQFILSSNGNSYFVLKLDSNGNFVWVEQFAENAASYWRNKMNVKPNGSIYLTGMYNGIGDFDPGIAVNNLPTFGSEDLFILKMNVCGQNYAANYSGCDSTIVNGINYTSSTSYTSINNSQDGCDSNTVVNIVIHHPTYSTVIQQNCDTSYTLNGQTYTTSGTYFQNFLNQNGCDSIITLYLNFITIDTNVYQGGPVLYAIATNATYQWISCNPFQELIGETNQTFTAQTNGDYALIVTINGCTDTSFCHTVMGLNTNDLSKTNSIQLFPNPVKKMLQVFSDLKVRKEIYNSMGQLLYTTKIASYQDEIDMSPYSSGIYYIKVGTIAKKFIVE
ncbi:MAG: SBBP repeat-containing protein [Bacteroidetes bacterium]|nr:SBBP repeat-containing protein [Bacteroidota bacterium]